MPCTFWIAIIGLARCHKCIFQHTCNLSGEIIPVLIWNLQWYWWRKCWRCYNVWPPIISTTGMDQVRSIGWSIAHTSHAHLCKVESHDSVICLAVLFDWDLACSQLVVHVGLSVLYTGIYCRRRRGVLHWITSQISMFAMVRWVFSFHPPETSFLV
jgi:hypothetical protein